ncbi:S-adenosyl-L-methionine-dependent methyltransferase [Choiromyces venosus 120613-1]|uniref:S-adenosyl-L-methionine-dependent methyltransferase n=1 Tax=Choiromyces venosus 120613-1 TaxID=1336337 RepID=A0A3N4IZ98_9PEZI|nr:S-adenosyl-L-methionine-dependent methyltransferase [Choiromyces venosus 120613-1]
MIHHMYRILLDGALVIAPIENPQKILDVGTGTGIWAIDVADEFPSAVVIGTDLSPIQPSWVPPNCKFEVDDAESEWPYAKNSFDLVHSRHLMNSIRDWQTYIRQIYESVKPGGWVQILEHDSVICSDDNSIAPDSQLQLFMDLYNEASEKINRPTITHKLSKMLEEAGFIDVSQTIYRLPWAPWAKDKKLKEIGAWMLANTETSFEAYGLAFMTRVIGKTPEEAKEICDKAHQELKSKKVHVYNSHYLIIARKPLGSD